MRIIYFYNEDWEKEFMATRLSEHQFVFYKAPIDPQVRDEQAEVLSVFVNAPVTAQTLDRFPNLKLIATRSTGFDHIDLAEAKRRGIIVTNVPTYGENTIAEFAFALILTLSRKIYDSYHRIAEEGSFSQEGLRGFDLRGKVLGVVGTGHIGQHAIRMANGFGMRVVAYDPFPKEGLVDQLGFAYVSFEDLLAQADIITLHAPYNEHTHHMLNRETMKRIKRGAYLINTARGGLVETVALVEALSSGQLAGAGIEVMEEEKLTGDKAELILSENPDRDKLRTVLANQYFIDHPRVIVTPHNAFNTQEAVERILGTTIENIHSFGTGNPQNMVG
ncbi:MAG: hypothetical protein A2408_02690 [Candidatus Yonathbacteria bacterium RIFOXYC1_FULL_52_10]|uniref:Hydroxyacid dehydrogenase n=1 Tax=Candidatus Yonathbacteria bacterium RIFOXYD1_FULL_52_36 TaxID=1802730 RepID=A0A1G2SMG0_9BACT|nr:MAG: hypothetical protein A2408_02690 [Candidatus Yonathbacteria bacterium RIFOXYC1_FULL_52_10]OHA85888.1 MAG: hypothetical protein A2591_04210 [Candidatus Yonathbacteria bacterium RIFOXYD1_FULL_52_36]